jgi:hypothetical protein
VRVPPPLATDTRSGCGRFDLRAARMRGPALARALRWSVPVIDWNGEKAREIVTEAMPLGAKAALAWRKGRDMPVTVTNAEAHKFLPTADLRIVRSGSRFLATA